MHCTRENHVNILPKKTHALLPDNYLRVKVSRMNSFIVNFFLLKNSCFQFKGTITHLYGDFGYVNENLYFSREMARNLQLQEGYIVVYIARKISEDIPIQIYTIKSIVQENWEMENDLQSAAPVDNRSIKTLSTHEKWLHGMVVGVKHCKFTIETNDHKIKSLEVELSRIDCTFLPMVGDDVSVLTLCETDATSQDYTGVVIEMRRLIPTNKKLHEGKVDCFAENGGYGTIDNDYIFYMNALQHSDNIDHKVDVGDRVIAEVISCSEVQVGSYKKYGWRCIKIIKDTDFCDKNVAAIPLSNELEFEDDENEHGISITKSNELKVLFCNNVALGETNQLKITVQNNSENNHKLNGVTFKYQNAGAQVACDQFNKSHMIASHSAFTFTMTVTSRIYGITYERIIFSFGDGFEIERCIKIDVTPGAHGTIERLKIAKHTKEYTKSLWNRKVDVQPGVRVSESPHFVFRRLKPFEVPRMLLEVVLETTNELNVSVKLSDILPPFSPFEFSNYKRCFQALLHLEEIALDHEFRKYDRSCVHFTRENTADGQYLAVRMENVMESRPSIIVGDKVYAQCISEEINYLNGDNQGNQKAMLYEGFIHKIKQNRLLIKFGDNFHQRYNGEDYRCHFKFTRSQFIKQHNAIETVNDPKILFPSQVNVCDMLQLDVSMSPGNELVSNYRNRVLPWYNKQLNPIQKKAIECILRGESRPMPYIIFGPPGTGKTSTIVELILQLFKRVGGSRIIVCAPSNSAANLIAKRIIGSKVLMLGEFIRIVSKNSIERELIPDELLPYSAMADIATPDTTANTIITTKTGLVLNANSVSLASYKLLISTCSSFGSLMYMKFKRSHFTHVIVDEAGQCLESEAMIPISLLNKAKGQIILAGDPMQLGPIVISRLANYRGLSKSYLARLLDRTPYTKYIEVMKYRMNALHYV